MNIKYLMMKLNQTCSQHIGKVIYALFLITLAESLFSAALIIPASQLLSQETAEISGRIISYGLLFAALVIWLTFQFGFSIMLLRLTRNENTNLGYLFLGFRKFNPAAKVILSFSAIFAAIAFVARVAVKFIISKLPADFFSVAAEAEEAGNEILLSSTAFFQAGIYIIIFFILALFTVIHFAFVFHLHFDEPKLSVPELFKKSFSMMNGNVFRLIGFALRAGGKNLITAIVFALIVTFIPDEKSGLSVLSFIFNLIYFINIYSALVKFYFTVPVLYNEILNPQHQIEIIIEDIVEQLKDTDNHNEDSN